MIEDIRSLTIKFRDIIFCYCNRKANRLIDGSTKWHVIYFLKKLLALKFFMLFLERKKKKKKNKKNWKPKAIVFGFSVPKRRLSISGDHLDLNCSRRWTKIFIFHGKRRGCRLCFSIHFHGKSNNGVLHRLSFWLIPYSSSRVMLGARK